ncbi:hypothetical protein OAF54_00780 [bacterium]|nr:hypothetical protein [bacterium]
MLAALLLNPEPKEVFFAGSTLQGLPTDPRKLQRIHDDDETIMNVIRMFLDENG